MRYGFVVGGAGEGFGGALVSGSRPKILRCRLLAGPRLSLTLFNPTQSICSMVLICTLFVAISITIASVRASLYEYRIRSPIL